jgi:hypothetical protein
MPIQWTSRLALANEAARLTGLRLEVYTAIRNYDPVASGPGPSIEDLAQILHRKEASMSGRQTELREAGLIAIGPEKKNATGHPAQTYIALAYRPECDSPKITVEKDGQLAFFTEHSEPLNYF